MLNLVQLQERLKDLPMQAIMQYANGANPQVPPFLALGELNRRKKMQESAQAEQAKEMAGAPSVKEQLEQATGIMALQAQQQPQQMPQQAAPQQMAAPMPAVGMAKGGIARSMDPEMLKKMLVMAALKKRGGIDQLPMRPDMFKRGDYAGGGIVAFKEGGQSAADVISGALEEQETADEFEGMELSPLQKLLIKKMKERGRRPTTEEERAQFGLPTEAPDTTARSRAELDRREKELAASDTFINRLMALEAGRFGSGKMGKSMMAYEQGRQAKMDEIRKLKAAAEDQREAAKIAFQQGRYDEFQKRRDAADKMDIEAIKNVAETGRAEAQTKQAIEGRTTDWTRRYNAYLPEVMQRLDIDDPEHPRVKAATAKMVDESIGRTRERLEIQQQGVGAQIMGRNLDIENAITAATEKITKEYKFPLAQARAEGNAAEVARLTKERDEKIARRESDIRASGGQPARSSAPETKSSEGKTSSKLPPGARFIGTSGGKKVYELPNGQRVIEQ